MSVRREPWGTTRAGAPVELFTLEHGALRARLASFGATLVALEVPDRLGTRADVVLGFDTLAEYESARNPYFGGIVGRCANRIACARFTLDGREHVLHANEGRHHLHGGRRGFDRRLWSPEPDAARTALSFRRRSPAGEEGYPGALDVAVTYALQDSALVIVYEARCDAPTLVNLTQHSYFNLAGAGTILAHELELCAERFVALDEERIPTGALAPVAGTPYDFRASTAIGRRLAALRTVPGGGYDVCYELAPRTGVEPTLAARLVEPRSGRVLELATTLPGLQLYGGNHLDGLAAKGALRVPRFGGVCLEAQHFPDAIHHAHFPPCVLRPGERYRHTTLWRFSAG